jgi:DoxX-like family
VTDRLKTLAISGLQWTLGVVVLVASYQFVFGEPAKRAFAHTGLPAWIRPALGGIEMVAALVFLLPPTTIIGGYSLLTVLFVAVVIHVLHGWYDVGPLVVYAMAVLTCMAHHVSSSLRGGHER